MEATLTAKAGIAETFRAETAPTSACNCHITSDRLLTRRLAIPLRKSAALINEIHPESSENSSLELIRYPRPFFKHINAPRELLHQINDSITKTCLNITSKRTAPHQNATSQHHKERKHCTDYYAIQITALLKHALKEKTGEPHAVARSPFSSFPSS